MTKYHHNKEVREGYPYGSVDEIGNNAPVLKDYADEHELLTQLSIWKELVEEWRMTQRDLKQYPLTSPFTGEELIEGDTFKFVHQYHILPHGWKTYSPLVDSLKNDDFINNSANAKRIAASPIQKEDSKFVHCDAGQLKEDSKEEKGTEAGKREFIICSAIHYKDGIVRKEQPLNIESGLVVCGRRHNNCWFILNQIHGEDFSPEKGSLDMGFLTSNNEYKTRKEAMIIAVREKQIYHNVPYEEGDILTSEDLWLDNDNLNLK